MHQEKGFKFSLDTKTRALHLNLAWPERLSVLYPYLSSIAFLNISRKKDLGIQIQITKAASMNHYPYDKIIIIKKYHNND
jgi:hypothetical protein